MAASRHRHFPSDRHGTRAAGRRPIDPVRALASLWTVGPAAFAVNNYNLTGAGNPDKITGVRVTGQFFGTLRMQPLLAALRQPAC